MSWLSDAFHGVENFASEAVSDVGSFWTHNASWLTPLAIGAGALAGGALLGPALFGGAEALFGGAEAGAELGAEAGAGAAEAGAGAVGAGTAIPGAVDISISPFVEGAADIGAGAGAEAGAETAGADFLSQMAAAPFSGGADVLAGGGPLDILGGTSGTDALALASSAPGAAIDPGFVALADETAPEEALLAGTGTTAEDLASTAPVAVGETGGGLQGGVDVAAAQAENLGAGSTGAQVAAGEPLGAYPTETAGQAFAAGRFPAAGMTGDLSVAQQDALTGGLLGQGPLPASDQAVAAAAEKLPLAQTIGEAPIAEAPPLGEGSPITTAGGVTTAPDVGASSIQAANAGPSGPANLFDKTTAAIQGAGKGLGGFLDNPLVKYGLPLGVMGGLMLKGPDKLPPQEQGALALANTEASFGSTEMTLAQNGQVSAADQASLDIQRQNARNQAYQLFASRGGGDPTGNTDYQQALQQIDAQIEAQKQTILNNMITNSLTALGGATQTLTNAAQLQVQNDASFNQSLTGALTSFGLIAAFSGSRGGGGNAASSATTNA